MTQKSRWIEDLWRFYWEGREHKKNSLMDQRSVEVSIETKERKLDRNGNYWGFVEKLSSLKKRSFSRKGKKKKKKGNKQATQSKKSLNILSSQNISQHKCKAFIYPKHTHTLNKSNQFYILKNKLRQISEHLSIHVFLVMAKSHCTCIYINSRKKFCTLCVKHSKSA